MLLLFLCCSAILSACSMEPSIWQTIENTRADNEHLVLAISDAFCQIREKFEREVIAQNLATSPLVIVGIWDENTASRVDKKTIAAVESAVETSWPGLSLAAENDMVEKMDDMAKLASAAARLVDGYAVSIKLKDGCRSLINLVDQNPRSFLLLRLVIREEMSVFVRITDHNGITVFLEELEVSPTYSIDPLLSPLGGFVIRFDKNSARPLLVDFGSVNDGNGHVMRINDSYHQPHATPPLPEFMPAGPQYDHRGQ
jgi:hypothetical protein